MARTGLRVTRWLLVVGSVALAAQLRAEEKAAKFVSLFNGKNLDGWVIKGKPAGWEVKDGVIRSEGAKGGEALRSQDRRARRYRPEPSSERSPRI